MRIESIAYSRDMFPRTTNCFFLAWPRWMKQDDGTYIPDLNPMHVSMLLQTPGDALKYAFDLTFEAQLNNENYEGPLTVSELFSNLHNWLDDTSRKDLNKVFNVVHKKFWTVVFEDPNDKTKFYVAFMPSAVGRQILDLYDGKLPEKYKAVDAVTRAREAELPQIMDDDPSVDQKLHSNRCVVAGEPDPDNVAYGESVDDADVIWSFYCECGGKYRLCKYGERESIAGITKCKHSIENPLSTYEGTRYLCQSEVAQNDLFAQHAEYLEDEQDAEAAEEKVR